MPTTRDFERAFYLASLGINEAEAATLTIEDLRSRYFMNPPSGGGGGGTAVDATATTKGVVQLAGALGGTAASPTVPGLADKVTAAQAAAAAPVQTVFGRSGNVTGAKGDVGLGNVDNTSDDNKPVSTATQAALDNKVATSIVGQANGIATLGADNKLTAAQVPAGLGGGSSPILGFFGDGSDGDVTISGNVTLTRTMSYANLTIASGANLKSSGYIVNVKGTTTVEAGGSLNYDGNNASSNIGGSAGNGSSHVGRGTKGGDNAAIGAGNPSSLGGSGGQGGQPVGGVVATAAGAATQLSANPGRPNTNPIMALTGSIVYASSSSSSLTATVQGGAAGAGGASETANSGSGGGGGAGVLIINSKTVVNNGTISANGGTGGTRNNSTGIVGIAGGGGGGGGVVIINYYAGYSGTGVVTVNGGAGGNGSAGSNGITPPGGNPGVAGSIWINNFGA